MRAPLPPAREGWTRLFSACLSVPLCGRLASAGRKPCLPSSGMCSITPPSRQAAPWGAWTPAPVPPAFLPLCPALCSLPSTSAQPGAGGPVTALAARPGTSARPRAPQKLPAAPGAGALVCPAALVASCRCPRHSLRSRTWSYGKLAAWMWTVGSGWGVTVKSMFRECSPFLFFTYLNCFLCIHFCYHRLYYINNKKIKAPPCCHPWLCPESRAGSSYLKCPRGIGSSGRNPEALRQSRRPSVKLALNVPAACARSRSELSSLEPPLWCSRIGGVLGALGLGFGLAQWVKDPVLPQLRPRSDPWPGNSMRHRAGKNGKKTKN